MGSRLHSSLGSSPDPGESAGVCSISASLGQIMGASLSMRPAGALNGGWKQLPVSNTATSNSF